MKNTVIAIVVAAVVIVGGYLIFRNKPAAPAPDSGQMQDIQKAVPSAGGSSDQSSAKPEEKTAMPETAAGDVVLKTATDQTLGNFLVASNGMTLYRYTKDTAGVTNCYDQCAVNWPPYTVSSSTDLKGDASVKGKITTVKRTDGAMQVAYNGMPLYFWKNDMAAGDTTGQNVGGVWFVVSP